MSWRLVSLNDYLVVGNKKANFCLECSPRMLGGFMVPFDEHILSDGWFNWVLQPPTRNDMFFDLNVGYQ